MDNTYAMRHSENVFDYRCDTFKNTHEEKHILFIGDSFAAGDGLEKEDTWCYKLHSKISEKEPTSGYFNAGISGSSITESIDQFFKYCYNYGNPDIVFFVTTEFYREERYIKQEFINSYIFKMYMYLEQYCKSNNIKLYSFSWVKSIDADLGKPKRHDWVNSLGKKILRPLWTEQSKDNERIEDLYTLNYFKSHHDYSSENMIKKVFEFDSKTTTPKKSLWAEDDCHPGTSFHDFYADLMYNVYKGDS